MAAIVDLKNIVDALETQMDEMPSFLNLDTGEVEAISGEMLRGAEDGDDVPADLPEWEKEEREIARRIVSSDRFLELPSKFDIHEWNIMQDFSHSVESATLRDDLLRAIHGSGAFRKFKNTVERHDIESSWYEFRTQALPQIAIDWCEENNFTWAEPKPEQPPSTGQAPH